MSIAFVATINSLPIDGFTINGFGVTSFRTFAVVPLEGAELSAVAGLGADEDDECCTGVVVPPAKSPVRTPWGTWKAGDGSSSRALQQDAARAPADEVRLFELVVRQRNLEEFQHSKSCRCRTTDDPVDMSPLTVDTVLVVSPSVAKFFVQGGTEGFQYRIRLLALTSATQLKEDGVLFNITPGISG